MKIVAGIVSSMCDDSPPDGFELTEADHASGEMEGRLASPSYFCSAEAIGFIIGAATTGLTEMTSTDTESMTQSFVEEQEGFICFGVCTGLVIAAHIATAATAVYVVDQLVD